MNVSDYLKILIERGGSDLHLKVGRPPIMRIKGELLPSEYPSIKRDEMKNLLFPMLTEIQTKKLEEEKELDFSFLVEGLSRFRGNIFHQMGNLGAVFRVIPVEIKTIDQLGLPQVLKELVFRNQGIILVTGPTGSGKSTTLAAMIDYLNENRSRHIITVEDPVEFVHRDKKCVINQREIGVDTRSFSEALRRALRQDPDVILVGEMRDPETINIAMTAAETGHLVFSTLHTNDAKQSIDRIIDTFSPEQQHQVRMQLAMTLLSTISQRLIKRSDGSSRVAVVEVMINTPTIRKMIEEGKVGAIDKVIHDSASLYKMQTMNQDLFRLFKEGIITKEDALSMSNNPNDLRIMFQTQMPGIEPTSTVQKPSGIEGRYGKF